MDLAQKFEFFAPIWRVMVSAGRLWRNGCGGGGGGGWLFFCGGGTACLCPCSLVSSALLPRCPPLQHPSNASAPAVPAPHPSRLQRDSNMGVEEVRQQVEYVALATKQASSISDLRRFAYLAPTIKVIMRGKRAAAGGGAYLIECTNADAAVWSVCKHGGA